MSTTTQARVRQIEDARLAEPSQDRPLDAACVLVSLFCSALWAGNTVAVKACVPAIPAFACAGLRFALALPIIWCVCRLSGEPIRVPRTAWGYLVASGVLNFVQIGTFTLGTSLTHAGRASVLINIHPLIVVPLSCWLLGEPFRWRLVVGAVVAVTGVGVMFYESLVGVRELLVGDGIVFFSGVVLGFYVVLQKYWLRMIPRFTFLFWSIAFSVPLFGAVAVCIEPRQYRVDPGVVAGLLYQVVVVSGLAFSLWMWLLSRYPASPLSVLGLCTPVFGVLFGHVLRGEPLTRWLVLGCALLVTGLYLVVKPPEPHRGDGKGLSPD